MDFVLVSVFQVVLEESWKGVIIEELNYLQLCHGQLGFLLKLNHRQIPSWHFLFDQNA